MCNVESSWKERGISEQAREILSKSWKSSTRAQYKPYITKWELYCSDRRVDPMKAPVENVINFLSDIFETGVGYSAVDTARSALSTFLWIDGKPAGEHPLVCRFMRGVFNIRPALPRYEVSWDVKLVFKYLKKLHPPQSLSLKDLSLKLVMLLALLAGQRHQTLSCLDVINMSFTENAVKFRITEVLKHTRPGHHIPELVFPAYDIDERLCPVKYIIQYLKVTRDLRMKE